MINNIVHYIEYKFPLKCVGFLIFKDIRMVHIKKYWIFNLGHVENIIVQQLGKSILVKGIGLIEIGMYFVCYYLFITLNNYMPIVLFS